MKHFLKKILSIAVVCAICGSMLSNTQKAEAGSASMNVGDGVVIYGAATKNGNTVTAVTTCSHTSYLLRANIEYTTSTGVEKTVGAVDAYSVATQQHTFGNSARNIHGRHRIHKGGAWSSILLTTP